MDSSFSGVCGFGLRRERNRKGGRERKGGEGRCVSDSEIYLSKKDSVITRMRYSSRHRISEEKCDSG